VQRERHEDSSQCPPRSVHVGRTRHEPGERLADRLERSEGLCFRVPKRRLVPRGLRLTVELLECGGRGLALGLELRAEVLPILGG
jgi:hypothetical protein